MDEETKRALKILSEVLKTDIDHLDQIGMGALMFILKELSARERPLLEIITKQYFHILCRLTQKEYEGLTLIEKLSMMYYIFKISKQVHQLALATLEYLFEEAFIGNDYDEICFASERISAEGSLDEKVVEDVKNAVYILEVVGDAGWFTLEDEEIFRKYYETFKKSKESLEKAISLLEGYAGGM